ncbi:MAG: DNA polymerase III subunit beta [Actinomycetaceae bacterium]|nr:DNA polymerase III subunit beta [Actinomycetaceae bacterium]MDY5854426.1 DNA polymerase III subunit beta [Arcanobacterium sp.]
MRLQVEKDLFTDAVGWVARTIPHRPAVPVLAGMRIVADGDGHISLSSRDSDITSHVDIEADVIEPGEILVNGKLLADICRALPSQPIIFSTDGRKVDIECGSARFSMKVMTMDDYAELHDMPPVAGTVDGAQWQEAVQQVTIAASNDDTLPMLVSVCIEIHGDSIMLMATDRYRLAVKEISWKPEDPDISVRILVRAARLLDIAKALGSAGPVDISLNDVQMPTLIGFAAAGRQNTVQLIDGDYPQVLSLFPEEIAGFAVMNRSELSEAIKRARLVVEKNSAVRLAFSSEELVLDAGQDVAQASEAIAASVDGKDITMAFNPVFLQEGLSVINEQSVRLSYTQETKPAVLTGQDDEGVVDESFRLLLMPIRTYGSR